jgi:hypothetical protein
MGYANASNKYQDAGFWSMVGDTNTPGVLYTGNAGDNETAPASTSVFVGCRY